MTNGFVTIGDNIARLRKRQGLSQTELADGMQDAGQTHWRQNTVSRVERGQQDVNLDEIQALEEVLDGDVLEDTEFAVKSAAKFAVRDMAVRSRLESAEKLLAHAADALAQATNELLKVRYMV